MREKIEVSLWMFLFFLGGLESLVIAVGIIYLIIWELVSR